MATRNLGIVMNGVTGRMGTEPASACARIVAIRNQGGVALPNGDRVMPDPILVGRNADKVAALAPPIWHRALHHRSRRGARRTRR